MWIPKGAVLIRGRHLFEARHLLEEIRYVEKHGREQSNLLQ